MDTQRIIALEGIDGSGKTVQFNLLCEYLKNIGASVSTMDFPVYEGFIGREIGDFLAKDDKISANEVDSKSMALWFAVDRLVNMQVDTATSDYIIMNRYTLSNAVYQSIRNSNKWEIADWVFELEHDILGIPKADAYIFFDIDESSAKKNISKKAKREYLGTKKDVYEDSDFIQQEAKKMYLECSKRYGNIIVIQCMENGRQKSADKIHMQVVAELKAKKLI